MPEQRWKNWLNLITPSSGRIRCEDGTYVNHGDALRHDASTSSREGRLYRSFWSGSVPATTVYDFALLPPAGVKLWGVTRISEALEGRLDVSFGVASSAVIADTLPQGANFDETLEDQALSTFIRASSVSGFQQRTSITPLISPTTTSIRTPSVQTQAGAQPGFDETHIPVFRYANPGGRTGIALD